MFSNDLVRFAKNKSQDLLILSEVTGSIENWFRAEVVIAAQKGFFGEVSNVCAEGGRNDLTFTLAEEDFSVEFKVVFNNKNLFGGYNGTRGICKDLLKLRADTAHGEKYAAVFFAFFLKNAPNCLPPSYTNTSYGIELQPPAGVPFEDFAYKLATQVIHHGLGDVAHSPGKVHVLTSNAAQWVGFWCYRVA